jgi:hypothetical protein
MVSYEQEQLQLFRQRGPVIPTLSQDNRDTDPFDLDIRIISRPGRHPTDGRPMRVDSLFGTCASCQC